MEASKEAAKVEVTKVPKPEFAKYYVLQRQDGDIFLVRLNSEQLKEAEETIKPYNKTYKVSGADYNVEYKLSRPETLRSQKQLKKMLEEDSKYYQRFQHNGKL